MLVDLAFLYANTFEYKEYRVHSTCADRVRLSHDLELSVGVPMQGLEMLASTITSNVSC